MNGDGFLNLVLHFDTKSLELTEMNEMAFLMNKTFDGFLITGSNSVMIIK